MTQNFLSRIALTVLCFVCFTTAAFAMDLTTAKSQGLVGELPNGLVGVVKNADGVQDLVNTVNTGRMAIYTQNAQEQKISVDQIQSIAGKKLQSSTPAGHIFKILTENGHRNK